MKLKVTDQAATWLRDHLHLQAGDRVALVAEKTANGVDVKLQRPEEPGQPVTQVVKDGVTYYVDFSDEWYFSGKVTTVDYAANKGIVFHFKAEDANLKIVKGNVVKADSTTAASRAFEDIWE